MSDREPIRRVDWDAAKAQSFKEGWNGARDYYTQRVIVKALEEPAKPKAAPPRDYSQLRLTLKDLKFLYEIGVSCE